MKNKFEHIFQEDKNLNRLSGSSFKEVLELFEESSDNSDNLAFANIPKNINTENSKEQNNLLDGFLFLLRNKGVRVSTPEWMQFLKVLEKKTTPKELEELINTKQLLDKLRSYAKITLIKNETDESAFYEAFEEYFGSAAKKYNIELNKNNNTNNQNTLIKKEENSNNKGEAEEDIQNNNNPENTQNIDNQNDKLNDSNTVPEIQKSIQTQEIENNIQEGSHSENEQKHGGKKDQHNDILRKADLSKQGGGDKKDNTNKDKKENNKTNISAEIEHEQKKPTQEDLLTGGGKGKSIKIEDDFRRPIIYDKQKIDNKEIVKKEERASKNDRRKRYEERPDTESMEKVVRSIRKIIMDVSEFKSNNINIKGTVKNFARRDFQFDYQNEKEKQPEIVLLIDVGGPVDEWRHIIKEATESMVKGLTKLEIYLFHNNLYGYVWKPDQKNILTSSYAKPNSLIDIKSIIKKRKKLLYMVMQKCHILNSRMMAGLHVKMMKK